MFLMVAAPFKRAPVCPHPYVQGVLHSLDAAYDSRDTPPVLPHLGTSDTHGPAAGHGSNEIRIPNLSRVVQRIFPLVPARTPPDRRLWRVSAVHGIPAFAGMTSERFPGFIV